MVMKNKLLIALFAPLVLGSFHVRAQESIVASGGEATGTGGSSSYSIGQVSYTSNQGTGGSVEQGVQQPFEIYAVLGMEKRVYQFRSERVSKSNNGCVESEN